MLNIALPIKFERNGKIKDVSYVFDFASDRTLKMVSEAVSISAKAGKRNS